MALGREEPEALERLERRFLLGVLLRPPHPRPDLLAVHERRTGERPVVRRPVRRERHVLDALPALRELLLERRLVVDRLVERLLDPALERGDDRRRDLVEPTLEVEARE